MISHIGQQEIDANGWTQIRGVLSDDECEEMVSGLWDYFEHITQEWEIPVNRNNTDTWKEIYNLYPNRSMLFQFFNIGQSQVCWDIRQKEKIVEIFAKIWIYF